MPGPHNLPMSQELGEHHIYSREIRPGEHSSLSLLAELIAPGEHVLDLGCGTGALGRHLTQARNCIFDGLTLSHAEAEQASQQYRRVEVADLETANPAQLLAGHRYDTIVCADVLEHLRRPAHLLDHCRTLLAPEGRILVSVPNAAYAGLVLELMHGEFRYRPEGLLDHTHLRFFTRQSLTRFFIENGWQIDHLQTVQRALDDSEFRVTPDSMPASVARYLLAQPDALAYQFIATIRPADAARPTIAGPLVAPVMTHATFTAQLYWAEAGRYDEAHKGVASGHIGSLRQTLRFALPQLAASEPRLRFDPADRPGFLHLHSLTLNDAQGIPCWRWHPAGEDASAALQRQPCNAIGWGPVLATAPDTALLLLTGDDPWVELPIPPELLAHCMSVPGSALEAQVGWPMSADYMALAAATHQLQAQAFHTEQALARLQTEHRAALHTVGELQPLAHAHGQLRELSQQQARQLQALERSLPVRAARSTERLLRRTSAWLRPNSPQPVDADKSANTAVPPAMTPLPAQPDRSSTAQPQPTDLADGAQPHVGSSAATVDIIIPVYRGLAQTQSCLQSVLASTNRTPTRVIVINDASPEPELTQWLRTTCEQEARLTLLENETNLGFVATVNRGMALQPQHDVVLLNSDTEVAADWLDRLRQAAYREANIGTATPLSNNATICSYPRFCESNPLPAGQDTAAMDALCAQTNAGASVDIPTAVGFCMYIRRDCLRQTGSFDVEHFGAGYGEENDFCLRATALGWRHVLSLDTFVQHWGGVSFGAAKNPRELAAQDTLRKLHPQYEAQVQAHIAADPARPYRQALDIARLRVSAMPRILAVLHGIGGGTRRHVHELAAHLRDRAIHLSLTPLADHFVRLRWEDPHEAFAQDFHWPTEASRLRALLQNIGIAHIHYHHLLGVNPEVMLLPEQLDVSYDFTAHDYYSACPQIAMVDTDHGYCGERGVEQCTACLTGRPAPTGETIEDWRLRHRLFLNGARHVLAPSLDAAHRLLRYFPQARVRHAPHLDLPPEVQLPTPTLRRLDPAANLRVFVLGALSQIKGADLLKAAAAEAARLQLPLEFHLLGYPNKPMPQQPHASLTIHGAYEDADLPLLLQRLQPDLVWFPARWPETYSYTLSACLATVLPVLATDLGAFRERLAGRPWSWMRPWSSTAGDWLACLLQLREQHYVQGEPALLLSASIDHNLPPWSYDRDYLAGL